MKIKILIKIVFNFSFIFLDSLPEKVGKDAFSTERIGTGRSKTRRKVGG